MTDARDILDAVALQVADFESPDWDALSASHAALADSLERLRRVQELTALQRKAVRATTGRGGVAAAPDRIELPFDWGTFEVRERLGRGSGGEVFRAFDRRLCREVALKLSPLRAGGEDVALAEARRLASVRHPNVLSIHGAELRDGRVGLWTSLLRGHTLEEKLRREGPISAAEASLIGIDLCRALRAVHAAGLVHGDVKTQNVMREDDGSVVLLDFDAASVLTDLDAAPARGTPLAMAPELWTGAAPTQGSDLYSLGVVLYRVTSGDYPVSAASAGDLARQHREGVRTPLLARRPELPAEFALVVERALAPDPRERFAASGELESALSDFLERARADRPGPASATARHNLPLALSSFVGRERELRRVRHLVESERLVTLTGAGGSGKTRLAEQVARSLLVGFVSEIRWVELAGESAATGPLPALGAALGLREPARRSWLDLILEHLADRSLLLILDNCEHMVSEVQAVLRSLLSQLPSLRVIATSREPLALRGELVFPVPPLALPADPSAPPEEIAHTEAVALFQTRAESAGARLVLDTASAPLVARICQRLDGIPLAIELAAARVRSLSLAQILDRLDHRFSLLVGNARGVPRHETLAAAIDWSYELLTVEERIVFGRLAVFSAGWTLEAAESIAGHGEIEASKVLRLLERLIEQNLVESDPRGETARYRMLETLRSYAGDRLDASGERTEMKSRHRDYFLRLTHEAAVQVRTPEEKAGIARIAPETENLLAAFESCLSEEFDLERGLQFTAELARLWFSIGRWNDARGCCARMLARVGPRAAASVALCDTMQNAGYLELQLDDDLRAEPLLRDAQRMAEALGDRRRIAAALGYLGNLAFVRGQYAEAAEHQTRSLALNRELGNDRGAGIALSNLGNIAELSGDLAAARTHHEEGLALSQRVGDTRGVAYSLARIADTDLLEKRFAEARPRYEQSLELRREMGDRWGVAVCLSGLAHVLRQSAERETARSMEDEALQILRELGDLSSVSRVQQRIVQSDLEHGELEHARAALEESLRLALQIRARYDIGHTLLLWARFEHDRDDPSRAARLLGAATEILAAQEGAADATSRAFAETLRARLEQRLGSACSAAETAAGRELSEADAVALALDSPRVAKPSRDT